MAQLVNEGCNRIAFFCEMLRGTNELKETTNVKFDWLKDENGSVLVNSLNINMWNIYYGQLLNVQGVLLSNLRYI